MPMGFGKTVTVLSLLKILYHLIAEEAGPTLVLAPLRVARDTWPSEIAKWAHLHGLTCSTITGTPEQRRAALARRADVYFTNYDSLVWLAEELGGKWPFTRVVCDESTKVKSFRTRQGGVRAKVLGAVAHTKVTHWVNLTGTPSPNGLEDLWGQQWFIDAGQRLGLSFSAFQRRWFTPSKHPAGFSTWAVKPEAHAEIQARLADCSLSLNPADWFDLKAPIVNVITLDLPAKARKAYRDLEKAFFAEIDGKEVEALSAAAKSMKLAQCASGAVYLNPGDYGRDGAELKFVEVHDAKLDALASVVEEAGGAPVLVAYQFRSDLHRLQRAFPQGRQLDTDPRTIADWNAGAIPILFAHPASAGHGLNLQDGGNILVFFSQTWNLEHHDQILERIGPVRQMQAGHDRPVFLHYLVARDTLDETMIERRDGKRSVQDALMEYVRRRA
jgi:SNF2 family DNA or RNA helicase